MMPWLYKWLPIVFGCHCRADRSFYWRGKQFPICARCTGELIGILLCAATAFFWLPSTAAAILLLVPMVADGFFQLLTTYESTNFRRVVTGTLFGYGLCALFLISSIFAYQLGYNLNR